jgi:hypothetical protein
LRACTAQSLVEAKRFDGGAAERHVGAFEEIDVAGGACAEVVAADGSAEPL